VTIHQAIREIDLLLDLEELGRYVSERYGDQVARGGIVHFTWRQWAASYYRDKTPPGEKALRRHFERWKRLIIDRLGEIFVPPDQGVVWSMAGDIEEARSPGRRLGQREVYAFSLPRVAELASAYALKTPEVLPKRPDRDVPIKDIFKSMGVGYSLPKIRAWRELGMPVKAVRHGKRKFWYGHPKEIDAWVEEAARRGLIQDPMAAKVDIDEAAPILIDVRKRLSLSVKRMAKLLGTTTGRLNSYMRLGPRVRHVPRQIVEDAQALLEAGVPEEKFQLRKGSPPLEEIKQALVAAKGQLSKAAEILREAGYTRGISPENMRRTALEYGIPYADWSARQVEIPTEEELRRVLKETNYKVRTAAREIGVSPTHLRRVIERRYPQLMTLIEFHKIDEQALIEAAEAARFDTAEAAKLLNTDRDGFRRMLRRFGLLEWYDAQGQPAGGSAAGANPTLWSNRMPAVGWSWAPFRP